MATFPLQIQLIQILYTDRVNQFNFQIQSASYDLLLLSSSRFLLSSLTLVNVLARSKPSSGLVASLLEPGVVRLGGVLAPLFSSLIWGRVALN